MSNHSALAIANEFLRMSPSVAFDQMKLQKLVYIAHGWNLAINGEPLVKDGIQAWDGGPVFRAIWDHIRDYGLNPRLCLLVNPASKEPFAETLSDKELAVLNHVWNKYGADSGKSLSNMTHQRGTPWYNSYLKGRNTPIADRDIAAHYIELARAGRDRSATA